MTSVDTQYRDRGIGAPAEQRKEFRRAFTDYGWARPGTERPAARPHLTLIVATVATLLALIAGVAMQLIKPVKLAKPAAAPAKVNVPTWAAVTGWDCAAATDHGFDVDGRQSTWATVGRGGWSRDGCHGDYEAIPFTTGTQVAPPTVQWWFQPGGAMKRCTISVFVATPDPATYLPVAGVGYSVLGARGGTEFARFTVNQTGTAGTWVAGGTFPVTQGGIAVRLIDVGNPPPARAMLAVAQAKAQCAGGGA